MSKFLRLSYTWKINSIAPEHPSDEKYLIVDIIVFIFNSLIESKLSNKDMRLLKKMKNNTISSGELILAIKHDNESIRKLIMQYIKSPKNIIWRVSQHE